ncbi:MAG: DUF5606 domain-containing protein [Flavobacteriales bacterium]
MINLDGFLVISGKPGLYKVISQLRNGILVEDLDSGKRMPVPSTARMSALGDIAMYSYDEEVPLKQVMFTIFEKESEKQAISHKSSGEELKSYFREVFESYDEDRVYVSDIKKVLQWYNILQSKSLLEVEEEASTDEAE